MFGFRALFVLALEAGCELDGCEVAKVLAVAVSPKAVFTPRTAAEPNAVVAPRAEAEPKDGIDLGSGNADKGGPNVDWGGAREGEVP